MTYLQGFITLQKGHMGQQEAVYDLSGGVYDTSEVVYGTIGWYL